MPERTGLANIYEANEPLVGTWAVIPDPSTVELLAGAGYDFLAIDQEHSPVSYETIGNLLRAVDAAPGETESLVRVADDDPTTLKRTLDLGPSAILVPMVETAEQAAGIVTASRYPPAGRRGLGVARASDYGRSLAEHVDTADHAVARYVQIETERAVENAPEIAAVEGVDGVFVGPVDLSMSMDCLGEWDDAAFLEAIDRVVSAADDAGVAVGTLATTAEEREARLAWGVDYLVAGVDVVHLNDAVTSALEHSRDVIAGKIMGTEGFEPPID